MSKIRTYLWAFIFFSITLSVATAAEQTIEKKEPPITKDAALSRLMEGLLREKSSLPLNINPSTPTPAAKEAAIKESQRQDLEANTPSSQAPQSPPAIAVGIIVRFKSPEIQALTQDNLPPPPEVVAELEAALGEKLIFERATVNEAYVFSFLAPKEGEEAIAAFLQPAKELPSIDWIEANKLVQIQSSPVQTQSLPVQAAQSFSNDPDFSHQWNMMGAPGGIDAISAWDITHGSANTVVAVVDSGVIPHPEFSARLLPGYDFVSDPYSANDRDGRDNDASDPGDGLDKYECGNDEEIKSSWHGTHVAGIIAASGDNGFGVAGVNWNTRILPVRVFGKPCVSSLNSSTDDDILAGITWAAGIPVPSTPLNTSPAQVINLSLKAGEGSCPIMYQKTINEALARGILIVVAAGNHQPEDQKDNIFNYYPASCNNVLTVVATNIRGEAAEYTNKDYFNADIAAPGGDKYGKIYSTVGTGRIGDFDYGEMVGTSMAAPHVSGIASLALAVNPNLSGAELYPLLRLASRPIRGGGECGYLLSQCGSGIADAYHSVKIAEILKKYRLVYEFQNFMSNHYMLTASKEQMVALTQGGKGLEGWFNTKEYFYAWSGPEEGAVPVCRFYTLGANSHFYTASAEDCAFLRGLNPDNVYAYDKWTYEDIAFYAKLPINGSCPADSAPVYRVYNNRWMYNDSNHRFISSDSSRRMMLNKGWVDEGVAFCVAFVDNSFDEFLQ